MPASTLAATAAAAIIAAIYAIHVAVLQRNLGRDPVTGLPVRAAFLATRRRHLRGKVVIFLDLDRFKIVNDRHGHGAGNTVLHAVAGRLRDQLGDTARLCRLSGDEFAAVADLGPATGPWETRVRALLPVLTAPIELVPGGPVARIGVSLGAVHLAGTRRPCLSGSLHLAEEQMYRAKFAHTGARVLTARPGDHRVSTPAATQPLLRLRDTRVPVWSGR
jgi:diguanylate cyclase (GGDEF)-like protein